MKAISDVNIEISKDEISFLVTVTDESRSVKLVKRFFAISDMGTTIEEAKKEFGLEPKF